MIWPIPHNWRFPIFLGAIAMLSAFLWLTSPDAEDLIDVRDLRVVALKPGTVVWNGMGCVTDAEEKEIIRQGDALYVAPEIWFLDDVPGEYRTKLRNVTAGRNIWDDLQWSQTNSYRVGRAYCKYHPLRWWAGRRDAVSVIPAAYVLTTEYRLHPSANRAVVVSAQSEPFVVKTTNP